MEALIVCAAILAFGALRMAMGRMAMGRGHDRDSDRADRQLPDPPLEDAVRAAVGPLPKGLGLSVARCEWAREADGHTQIGTRLAVTGVCPDVTIRPGSGSYVDVGDAELVGRMVLSGPPALLGAILDAPARQALRALVSLPMRTDSVRVFDGELRIDVADRDAPALARVARQMVAAAERLRVPDDLPARLAAIARDDEVPGVRLASLQTLLREFPEHARTSAAVRAAREDRDAEVRLAAARAVGGADGRALLLALARDTTAEDSTSAHALDGVRDVTMAELRPILEAAQGSRRAGALPSRPYTARACVEALGHLGEEAMPLLDGPLRSRNEAVARAAIRAVARIGGAAAVMPLQAAVEHHRDELQQAAERALGDVQAALVGTPGQISLTGADTGQVSLAEEAAGQVSMPDKGASGDER